MIKIERLDAYGFEAAIRGMRNPMNSWERSDSGDCEEERMCNVCPALEYAKSTGLCPNGLPIGKNDLDLMGRLFRAGTEHRKFMRQIQVSMDITAPFYWWKEFDTYKIGTTANSCSTMHKIHAKKFDMDDFSTEHLIIQNKAVLQGTIDKLNEARMNYIETNDKLWWWQMIQMLPSTYNQKRTITMNYEVAYRIIEQRAHHKLDEWHVLVDELKKLPYMKDIINEKVD